MRRAAALVVAGWLALAAGAGEPLAPLSDEDVVRMVAAGRSDADIVRVIEERDAGFDLADEMVEELRLAGVTQRVLDAMRARQAALHPPVAAPKPDPAPQREVATVSVRFAPAAPEASSIWIPAAAPDAFAKALQLPRSRKERRIDGLALFVACATPEHVPDQWRMRSPLGRDFVSMPRHELLALHARATRVGAKDVPRSQRGSAQDLEPGAEPEWLRLDLPAELSIGLGADASHDLVVGLAVLVGDSYLAIALDERKDVSIESLSAGLGVSVGRGDGRAEAVSVRFATAP